MKRLSFSLLLSLLALLAFSQKSTATKDAPFTAKLTVHGLENSNMILARYYGDKQYVIDTFFFDKKGVCNIKMDTALPGGIHMCVFPKLGNRYFEFVVNNEPINIETDTIDLSAHVKTTGSVENQYFYSDMFVLTKFRKESDSLSAIYKSTKDKPLQDKIREKLVANDKAVEKMREDFTAAHPDLFYSKLLLGMREYKVRDFDRDATGKVIDSAQQWKEYKAHYWDYFDLKDDRLLRSPIYHNKMKTFLTQTTVQSSDSVIASCEQMFKRMDLQSDIFRYTLSWIFNEVANSKVMGMDGAYVWLGENYFCKGYATWLDSVKLFKICDRVKRLSPVLIGKQAQRLILADTTETKYHSLYDMKNKWTLLAFWDPDCGHCKKEIPVLVEQWHNLKKRGIDIGAMAPVIMDRDDKKKWTDFIRDKGLDWINVADLDRHNNFRYEWDLQSTPQIYILDANKKIVARRIGAESVEDYVRHLEDPSYKPKNLMKTDDETHENLEH